MADIRVYPNRSSGDPYIQFVGSSGGDTRIVSLSNSDICITGTDPRLSIGTSTPSPSYTLDVEGTGSFDAIRFDGDGSVLTSANISVTGTPNIIPYFNSSSGLDNTSNFYYKSNRVALGTSETPNTLLAVGSTSHIISSGQTANGVQIGDAVSYAPFMSIRNSGTACTTLQLEVSNGTYVRGNNIQGPVSNQWNINTNSANFGQQYGVVGTRGTFGSIAYTGGAYTDSDGIIAVNQSYHTLANHHVGAYSYSTAFTNLSTLGHVVYIQGGQNNNGTKLLRIEDKNKSRVFSVYGGGQTVVENQLAAYPAMIVRAANSQSANIQEWQDFSSGVYAVITQDCEFSNAQGYTQSESFGDGAILGAAYSTVVGYGAKTSSTYSVAVGHSASGAGQQSVAIGYNARAPYLSVAVGEQAGASGWYSVAMGYQAAGKTPSTENYITAIGYQPLYGNAGYSPNLDYAVAIGYQAGYNLNASNDYIVAIGNQALYAASGAGGSTVGSVAIGEKAGRNGDGYGLIALGGYSADNYSSVGLIAIGGSAAGGIQNSNSSVCIGGSAGYQSSGVSASVLIGNNAGYRIGNPSYGGIGGGKKAVAIGNSAMYSYKGDPNGCVGIGGNALYGVSGTNNIGIGNGVGQGVVGSNNLLIGNLTGYNKGLVSSTLAIGSNQNCPQGTGNTVVNGGYGGGVGCLYNTSVGLATNINATRNTGCIDIGYQCGQSTTDSSYITTVGYAAGNNQDNSSDIINIGRSVGSNCYTNYDNINIGAQASQLCSSMTGVVVIAGGQSNYNSFNTMYNTMIGYAVGGSAFNSINNIWIGYNAGAGADACRDTIAIGSGAGQMQVANEKYESCVFIGEYAGRNCNGTGNIEILTSGSPSTSVLDNHNSRLNIANTIRAHLTSGTVSIGQSPTLNPSHTLSVEGSVSGNDYTFSDGTTQTTAATPQNLRPYVEITGGYTIPSSGYGVFISASGNTTITMPSVALGRTVNIIRIDNEAYTVTATGAASELFNGNPSLSIAPSNSVDLVSNGTNWYIK